MEELLNQNHQLKQLAHQYNQEVKVLKQRSSDHERQIQTLLKFNEKLLHIIEKQLNGQKIKNSEIMSLHPISEKTELESDVFQSQLTNNVFGSLIGQKKGNNTYQSHMRVTTGNDRAPEPMANIERQQQLSIVVDGQREFRADDWQSQISSLINQFKKPVEFFNQQRKLSDIQTQISEQIGQFQQIKNNSSAYYEDRLNKLKEIKENFSQLDAYSEIENMIDNLEHDGAIKEILREYLEQSQQHQ